MIETHLFSSLIKVFPDEKPVASELKYGSMLGGETYSFQIAYSNPDRIPAPIKVEAEGDLAQFTLFRRVGFFPVENMGECLREGAEKLGFERRKPGLYPDILYPDMEWTHCCAGNWYSIWAEIRLPKDYPAGEYDLKLKLKYRFDIKSNDFLDSESMTLKMKVIPANLPKQTLTHTEWFYCDCLANYYHLEPWSEPFWKVLENYFTNFAAHGINLLLTPIFTVALDTAQDKERLTTQLIGVQKSGDQYTFDFSLLKRWIDLAQKCGIEQFEFSHLFKQGGGKYPVKVVAEEDGVLKKIFDWNMSAQDPAY